MKKACKLKKGDRIYECRYHESTLTELVTDPELKIQGRDSHYWHWKAKVIETNSRMVIPGEIIEYGITEEYPAYGPKLFRKDLYKFGYDAAEPVLPPFWHVLYILSAKVCYGMEDDDEENIYCVIDINLRIVIPWQPMTSEEFFLSLQVTQLARKGERVKTYW